MINSKPFACAAKSAHHLIRNQQNTVSMRPKIARSAVAIRDAVQVSSCAWRAIARITRSLPWPMLTHHHRIQIQIAPTFDFPEIDAMRYQTEKGRCRGFLDP